MKKIKNKNLSLVREEMFNAQIDCWNYNKNILKEVNIKRLSNLEDIHDLEFTGWEDVAWFAGYLKGLEWAKDNLIDNDK